MTLMLDSPPAAPVQPSFSPELQHPTLSAWAGVPTISDAHELALSMLAVRHPRAWVYTQGVAGLAHELGFRMYLSPRDRELLTSAAWLHGIGVAMCPSPSPAVWATMSAALHLRMLELEPVASLVAWNGASREEASLLGLQALISEFPEPSGRVADALTYATMHVSPVTGERCTLPQRLVATRSLRGADSVPAQALMNGWQRLQDIDLRVTAWR